MKDEESIEEWGIDWRTKEWITNTRRNKSEESTEERMKNEESIVEMNKWKHEGQGKVKEHGYMRYLSIMKDLGPRRMNQDQRPRTQRSGFKIQNQNRNQLPRFKNKDQESKPKPKEPRFKGQEPWVYTTPFPSTQYSRTKSQKPKSTNQDSKILRSEGEGQMTWTIWQYHNEPAWKLMSQYEWVRLKVKKEPFMINTTWSNG